jgi:hypothetical protein
VKGADFRAQAAVLTECRVDPWIEYADIFASSDSRFDKQVGIRLFDIAIDQVNPRIAPIRNRE